MSRRNGSCAREDADDDRIVLHRAHHAPALDGEVDHLGEHQLACTRQVILGVGSVERRFQLGQLDLDGGEDDLLFGLELVVDRGLRHADRVRDHLQRRPVDAVFGEQVEGGGDDADLRGGARLGTQPAAGRGLGDTHATKVADRLAAPSRSATLAPNGTARGSA